MNRTKFYLPVFLAITYFSTPSTAHAQNRFRSQPRNEYHQRLEPRSREGYRRAPQQQFRDQNFRKHRFQHQHPNLKSRIWRDGVMSRKEQYMLRQHQLRQFKNHHPKSFNKRRGGERNLNRGYHRI